VTVEFGDFADPGTLRGFRDRMVAVYGAAFSGAPYSQGEREAESFGRRLPGDARNEGFRCVFAEEHGRLLGFAYGFTDAPGQWWHEQVAPELERAGLPGWLEGSFVLTELAVVPEAHGRGVGARLHDSVLADLPHRRAVLSTHRERTVARGMYDRRGWRVLLDDFVYPASKEPAVIMGLELPLRAGSG
jgi:GNAT superfamily N-acetyltransferase